MALDSIRRRDWRHAWRQTFSADPAIVGKTIFLNGYPLTIVGVAAPEFNGTIVSMGIDVFAPLMMQPQVSPPSRLDSRGLFGLTTMGHLKRGVTTSDATAEAAVFAAQLEKEHPLPNYVRRLEVIPIWKSPFGAQTYWLPAIGVLGGMGLLILLVVCANVANLVLVAASAGAAARRSRGAGRQPEPPGAPAGGRNPCWRCRARWRRDARVRAAAAVASGAAANAPSTRLPRHLGRWLRPDVCHCPVVRVRARLRPRCPRSARHVSSSRPP
jgi:hypothetical protein